MDLAKDDRHKVEWKMLNDARKAHDTKAMELFHQLSKNKNTPVMVPFKKRKGRWPIVDLITEGATYRHSWC